MSYKPWLVKLLPELAEILASQQLNPVAKLVPAADPELSSVSVPAWLFPEFPFFTSLLLTTL